MSVPSLKDLNVLTGAALAELEAWSRTPAAAGVPVSRIRYALNILEAIEGSASIGSLAAGFRNVLSTVEAFGVPTSNVSQSLVRLSTLLAERERKDVRRLNLRVRKGKEFKGTVNPILEK